MRWDYPPLDINPAFLGLGVIIIIIIIIIIMIIIIIIIIATKHEINLAVVQICFIIFVIFDF